MSLEARLQAASADFQKLQAELADAVEARQRLDAQLSENELVRKVRLRLRLRLRPPPHVHASEPRADAARARRRRSSRC